MNLNTIRQFFSPQAQPTAAQLSTVVDVLSQEVASAEADVQAARNARAENAIELLDSTSKAARTALAELQAFEQRLEDVRAACALAQRRYHQAAAAEQSQAAADQWAHFDSVAAEYGKTLEELQRVAGSLAEVYQRALDEADGVWAAFPAREHANGRPPMLSTALGARLMTYLHGATEGRLGDGVNWFINSQRPDLPAQHAEMVEMLLQRRPAVRAQVEVAA